ncbi:uncharacterized protein LOC135090873 isoform X3 [Scylla paramamosain]|uniref:uncharacterized protein LOC135090873 isoform X3 n=1 Tax=Scylla paramamosain TaxID=85552 RepID=UPI003083E425
MGGGTGNKGGYKNDDAEGMCNSVASLEPDPRYSGCCSNIFRPGRVVRDIVVGALVVLGVAVVVAVVFVVCYFFIPVKADGEAPLLGEESAFHGVPYETEANHNNINEVVFRNSTRYDVDPMLERIKEAEHEDHGHGQDGHGHDHEGHNHDHDHVHEHHHVGPVPEPDSEPEPEAEAEPEPEPTAEPEPEPEGEPTAEPEPEATAEPEPEPESDHTHSEMSHDHTHPEMDHDHTHPEMDHDHTHPEMGQKHGPVTHDHTHPEMDHNHTHPEMDHDHTHPEMDHNHTHPEMDHGHTHPEMDHGHTHPEMDHGHTHPEMGQEHTHEQGPVTHDHTHPQMDHDHMHPEMDHDHTHPAEGTPEAADPQCKDQGCNAHPVPEASESEVTLVPATHTDVEEGSLPPLFELFSPRTPVEEAAPEGSEGTLKELVVPHEHTHEEEAHAEPHPEVLSPVEETQGITEEVPQGKCQPRQLEMCSDLPHTLTGFPNWAGDQTEEDMQQTSLPFLRDVIVRSRCSPRAKEYSCAILEPPCTSDGTILPPCRTFCKSVAATCQEFITSRFSLSSAFDCEQFPDSSDPSVCFDLTQAEGEELQQTGPTPVHHPPDAPHHSITNEDFFPNSPLDPRTLPSEAQADSEQPHRATQSHPASESDVPPLVLQDEDYYPDYPQEGVINLAVNANSPIEYPNDFTEPELPTTLPSDVAQNPPSNSGSFAPSPAAEESCSQDEFGCVDGSACLPSEAVCDGIPQCGDGSDEGDCQRVGCNTGEFQCATTGQCVPESWVCDGTDDCRDNSDETDCDLPPLQEPSSSHAEEAPPLENLTPLGQFPLPGGYLQDVYGGEEYDFNKFGGGNSFLDNGNNGFPPSGVSNGINGSHTRDYARELFPGESDEGTFAAAQEALVSLPNTGNNTQGGPQDREELETDNGDSEPGQEGAREPGNIRVEDFEGYESRLPFDSQVQDFPQQPYQSDTTVQDFPENPAQPEFGLSDYPENPSQPEFGQSDYPENINQADYSSHTFPEDTNQDTHQPDLILDNFPDSFDQYDETLEEEHTHAASDQSQNYDVLSQPPYYDSFGQITDHNQPPPVQDESQSLTEDEIQPSFRELPSEIDYNHPQLLTPEESDTSPKEVSQQAPQEASPDYTTNTKEITVEATGSEPTETLQDHLPQEHSLLDYEDESPYSPYQPPLPADFPQPANSPTSLQGDQTPPSPPPAYENQEHNEESVPESVLNEDLENGGESEQTLKSIDIALPVIDYDDTPDTAPTPTTTTAAPTPSRGNRLRGSTRFAYSRRPFTHRPSPTTLRTGAPASARPSPQPTASSFLSRLQKWRTSRIPSYESLRTPAAKERMDTDEVGEEEPVGGVRVSPRPRGPPFRRGPNGPRSYGTRPTLRTSRIDSVPGSFPQEFLKEGIKPEGTFASEEQAEGSNQEDEKEDGELAASVLAPVHITAPTQRTSQWHPPPRMYRRNFMRDNLELQRTRYNTRRTLRTGDEINDYVGEERDERVAEAPQFSYASEIPDYSSSDYASPDYQMHASHYPS